MGTGTGGFIGNEEDLYKTGWDGQFCILRKCFNELT